MQNYGYTGIVSKAETEALKELIFNRARQRAEAIAKSTQEEYTSSFRNEIMDIARSSFNTPGNPFAQRIENQQPKEHAVEEKTSTGERKPYVGFKQKTNEENIKRIIKSKNEMTSEAAAGREISGIMNSAGVEFADRKNFTGALEFLNSQASIYMASQKKAKFDAIA